MIIKNPDYHCSMVLDFKTEGKPGSEDGKGGIYNMSTFVGSPMEAMPRLPRSMSHLEVGVLSSVAVVLRSNGL